MLRVWCCWLGLVGVALADGALDFEKDAAGGSPSGWAGTAVVVEKDAIGGKRSLLLTATKDNDVASSPPLPAKAGQKYLLTYRLKLNVQRGAFHVQFRCLDEQRRPLRPEWKYPYIESRKTSLANPILISQQVSLADVESATAFVQIVFKWYDSPLGEAWIDDVSWQPLAEKAQVRNARPLDIRSACNMGFRDEKEGDGVGGWTDQGENDLRNLKPGTLKLDVLPLEVIDPAKNDGRSCIVLGGGAKPNFPQRVSIPVGQRADRVFALHNSAWSGDGPDTPVVQWTFHHADGSTSSATLRVGKDMSDWWRCANTDNSVVAVTTSNAIQTPVCLNVAEIANPKPEQAIASIEIASAGRPMYGLVAVTLADGPPLMPWLKLQAEVEYRKATDRWFACPMPWGAAEEPSPTNVSWLLEKPAGKRGFVRAKDGRFVFDDGTRARFMATTCGWSAWAVSHEDAERMAAYLARMGVNALRIFPQGNIAGEDPQTFTLDADKQEKLDYLIAQLKQRGIYVYWYTSILQLVRSPVRKALMRGDPSLNDAPGFFDPQWLAAEERYWRLLLTHVNPYTGKALADDPVMALLIISNEDEMFPRVLDSRYALPPGLRNDVQALWNRWLVERYGDRAKLVEAWKAMGAEPALSAAEDPVKGTVAIPETAHRGRIFDFRRFCATVQRQFAQRMTSHLRSLGVQCPIQHTNHIYTPEGVFIMADADFSGIHLYGPYQDGITYTVGNFSIIKANNPLAGNLWHFPAAGLKGRLAGKPFVLGEWNVGYPNDFRGGGVMQGFAYGLLQDWDCISYFCFFANPKLWQPDGPGVATSLESAFDPARAGLFPAIALMFHRQDITPAKEAVHQRFADADIEALGKEKGYPAYVWPLTKDLAWIPFAHRYYLAPRPVDETRGVALKGTGSELESAVQKLREAARRDGLIDEAAQVVWSDTRQLASDFHHGVITIDTPRTQGASGQLNEVERAALSGTEIRRASGFCTVIASSLDGEPLGRSQRILLTVVGDAANTDEVAIIDRHELANVPSKGRFHPSKYTFNANRAGRKPMVAEPVAATLAIRREAGAKALRCQGLDTAGRATGQVPVRLDGQWAEISLDARHRSIYFLLSSE